MKKTTLLFLSLFAILFAALREGGRQTPGGIAANGVAFLLPPESADGGDFDARDSQNRPLKTPSANQALSALFCENLLNLMVLEPPHAMAQVLAWADSLSALFNNVILMRLSIAFETLQEAILPSSKRFVHNVDNLWITFSVGVLAGSLFLTVFGLSRTPRQINLRC